MVHRCTCQDLILNWLTLNWKSVPKLPDLIIVGSIHGFYCSLLEPPVSLQYILQLSSMIVVSFRFLLLVRFWVLSLMYSVHCASMPEAYTHLFSASLSSVSSKCFCHLTTYLPCGGDGAQIH